MVKFFSILFSWQVSVLAATAITGILLKLILSEETVQPYEIHPWAEESITVPLVYKNEFTQEVMIPKNLADGDFMLALYFGREGEISEGRVSVALTQGSHSQSHSAHILAPATTMKKRFRFSGFSAGSAELLVTGLQTDAMSSPGMLYIEKGDGPELKGPGLSGPAYASVDWFAVIPGGQKLRLAFPNAAIGLLWFLPFSGLIALAWVTMGKNLKARVTVDGQC